VDAKRQSSDWCVDAILVIGACMPYTNLVQWMPNTNLVQWVPNTNLVQWLPNTNLVQWMPATSSGGRMRGFIKPRLLLLPGL